ncbi:MAG: hypothetical protein ACR2HP_02135 [Ilumatobacteraceae bacterium]
MSDTTYEARVITLPVERATTAARETAAAAADRQLGPVRTWSVDDWGRDPELVQLAIRIGRLRWNTLVGGVERLPARAGALVVVNARRFALSPIFTAMALTATTGRPARFVGRPDVAPVGAFVRRLGGLLDRPDELAGALRAGELVVMGAQPELHPRRVGRVDHRLIGAAVATGVSVFPAVTASSPWGRSARVEIGPVARPTKRRRGPLIELELADVVEQRIQRLLDALGGAQTGTPLDWLPFSGMGGS